MVNDSSPWVDGDGMIYTFGLEGHLVGVTHESDCFRAV